MSLLGEARILRNGGRNSACGVHVGSFFALGRLFSLLAGSQTLLALFWLMLVVFFGLGVAADSILGGLGKGLEPSKPHLSMIFGVSKHASQNCSSCNKTTVFAMFYSLRNVSHTATTRIFA